MIYTDQAVEIRLDTGIDLSAATTPKIMYEKPTGTTGFWVATVSGEELVYTTDNDDLDKHGVWKFQAFCQIGGLNKMGRVAKITIDKKL